MPIFIRKFFYIATLLLTTTWCIAQSQTRHVLFIGNSYVFTNNMPQTAVDFAASVGDTLIYDSHSPGGYTFWNHWNDTLSTNKIEAGGWDYVVLQDQSQMPAFDNYDFFYATHFSEMIREHSPCARPLFYMTWGRENGDALNCAEFPQMCTYEGMDSMLAMRYAQMGQLSEAEVSPVGRVWKHVKQNYPFIDLYQSDGSHPTPTGSYLIACCFYTSIFKKDPTLSTFSSTINADDAALIRQVTKAVLYDSLSNWDFTNSIPVAGFNYVVGSGSNELIFTNTSTNADSYLWEFGDGTTSTEINPTHNYANNGSYTITLTSTNCDLTTNYESIHVEAASFCAHTPTISPDDLILCPNASDTLWTQPYDSYQWFDSTGAVIPNATNQFIVPQPGLYSVMTTENNCSELSQQVTVASPTSTTFYVIGVGNSGTVGFGCIGDTAFLSIGSIGAPMPNLDPYVNWYLDSTLIPLPPNDSLMITESGLYGVTVEHPSCPGYIAAQYLNIDFVFVDCTTGFGNAQVKPSISFFPNPATDNVFIENYQSNKLAIAILDATGRRVKQEQLAYGENVLSLVGLISGIYIVKFDQANLPPIKLIKL